MVIARRRSADRGIPQASLADMAFLLLIFFIASTTFAIEYGLPLVLPSARDTAVVTVTPSEVFRVETRADGSVWADGAAVPARQIAVILQQRNAARRARGQEELVVVLETDPQAEYGLMVQVLDQVRLAGSRRIALKLRGGG